MICILCVNMQMLAILAHPTVENLGYYRWFSAAYTSFNKRAEGSNTPSQNGCLQKYGMVSTRPFPGKHRSNTLL